ncbi:hypothetical protein PLESTM_000490800 [Pleodorina starrii]|nr:hypothetical protein PLESTM_000490800 [Pleodorina starrii]
MQSLARGGTACGGAMLSTAKESFDGLSGALMICPLRLLESTQRHMTQLWLRPFVVRGLKLMGAWCRVCGVGAGSEGGRSRTSSPAMHTAGSVRTRRDVWRV